MPLQSFPLLSPLSSMSSLPSTPSTTAARTPKTTPTTSPTKAAEVTKQGPGTHVSPSRPHPYWKGKLNECLTTVTFTAHPSPGLEVVPYPQDARGDPVPVGDLVQYSKTQLWPDCIKCFCVLVNGIEQAVRIFVPRTGEHAGDAVLACPNWKADGVQGCRFWVNLTRLYADDNLLKLMPLGVFPPRLRRSNSVTMKGVATRAFLAAVKPATAIVKPATTAVEPTTTDVKPAAAVATAVICHAFLREDDQLSDDADAPDFMAMDLAAYYADLLPAAPPIAAAPTSIDDPFAFALTGSGPDGRASPLTGPLYEFPPLPMAFSPPPSFATSHEPLGPVASGSGCHTDLDTSVPTPTTRDKGKQVCLGDYIVNTFPGVKGEFATDAGHAGSLAPGQEEMDTGEDKPTPDAEDVDAMWHQLSRPGGQGLAYRRFMTMWGGCPFCKKIMTITVFLTHDCATATRCAEGAPAPPPSTADTVDSAAAVKAKSLKRKIVPVPESPPPLLKRIRGPSAALPRMGSATASRGAPVVPYLVPRTVPLVPRSLPLIPRSLPQASHTTAVRTAPVAARAAPAMRAPPVAGPSTPVARTLPVVTPRVASAIAGTSGATAAATAEEFREVIDAETGEVTWELYEV